MQPIIEYYSTKKTITTIILSIQHNKHFGGKINNKKLNTPPELIITEHVLLLWYHTYEKMIVLSDI